MRVVAGERAVHIMMTYDQAEMVMMRHKPGEMLYEKLATSLKAGRAKGYPRPPLPRSHVAHNSPVEIVK